MPWPGWLKRLRGIESLLTALSVIEQQRRQNVEESYNESRLPLGTEIQFLGFCLFEVFTIEDFRQLDFSRFFPVESLLRSMILRRHTMIDDHQINVARHQAPSIIVRDKCLLDPGPLGSFLDDGKQIGHPLAQSCVMPRLPHEILFVQVWPTKILPSLFAITIYVHLTKEGSQRLLELHNQKYQPTVILRRLGEQSILASTPSRLDSDLLRKKTIRKWKESLRREVEVALRPFLSGYFSNSFKAGYRGGLPVIDIYALKGGPQIAHNVEDWKPFYDWTSENSRWAEPIGIDLIWGTTYVSNLAYFNWGKDFDGSRRPVSQLLLWEESCLQKIKSEDQKNEFFSQSRSAFSLKSADELMDYASRLLMAMIPGISVLQVLEGLQTSIERLRLVAFSGLSKKLTMRAAFRLINKVTREAMLLDRIELEFRKDRLWPFGLFSLVMLDVKGLRRPASPESSLTTDTDEQINEKIALLKMSSAQVQKWLSESLSLKNTAAVLWLSFIALFVAILSLVGGWEAFSKLITEVSQLITNQ